jgi:hypothetical protein
MTRAAQIASRLLEDDPPDAFNDLLDKTGLGSTEAERQALQQRRQTYDAPSSATSVQPVPAPRRQPPLKPLEKPADAKDFINLISSPEREAERIKDALLAVDWTRYLPTKVVPAVNDDVYETGVQDVRIHLIDIGKRSEAQAAGSRVMVPGEPPLLPFLNRIVGAALKRAHITDVESFDIASVQPVHDGIDLENLPDDFEDDDGDWMVQVAFYR